MREQATQADDSMTGPKNIVSTNDPGSVTLGEIAAKPKRKVSAVLIVLIAIGILLAACIVFCVGVQYYPLLIEKVFSSQFINNPAPDFTLTTLEGKEVTLSQRKGSP